MGARLLVNIDFDDLPRATAFYTQALGLSIGRRFGDGGIELLGAEAPIYLLVKAAGSRACSASGETRRYERHWTPVHLDFVVDDLPSAIDRAMQAGAVIEDAMRTESWGRIAHFADPFGNGFCLLEFLNRGYDEIARAV
ncbi:MULTISPECIES: VOC family protein [Hydrocarboniphaga]|jgi:predicted enzyme related to lactoylglutathione lyase|uniref:Putative lyase n=1 Tax=Hydrocarboniphaga effusa AP103 TaxID=1172194 RepID=I8TCT5_9GAMM|nr:MULTISPECIES: VOC family protein [Hydrocarboniphaga]EIT71795.1 putative lyase [Hydrocarboniphaga effusa AP103]MDZ4080417.1 VOC family protein [Hydrocarboniphaga sp.]